MPSFALLSTVLILWLSSNASGLTCESCGRECAAACGTRNFRTCCFNYLRKRSDPPVVPELAQYYSSLRKLPSDTGDLVGGENSLFQELKKDVKTVE